RGRSRARARRHRYDRPAHRRDRPRGAWLRRQGSGLYRRMRLPMRSLVVLLCMASVAGAAPTHSTAPKPDEGAARVAVLRSLWTFAIGHAPDDATVTSWAERIGHGEATVAGYVDHLLQDPRFVDETVPSIVFYPLAAGPSQFTGPVTVLKSQAISGQR